MWREALDDVIASCGGRRLCMLLSRVSGWFDETWLTSLQMIAYHSSDLWQFLFFWLAFRHMWADVWLMSAWTHTCGVLSYVSKPFLFSTMGFINAPVLPPVSEASSSMTSPSRRWCWNKASHIASLFPLWHRNIPLSARFTPHWPADFLCVCWLQVNMLSIHCTFSHPPPPPPLTVIAWPLISKSFDLLIMWMYFWTLNNIWKDWIIEWGPGVSQLDWNTFRFSS